jgi:cysteine desulfurase/selenocysteine lyase
MLSSAYDLATWGEVMLQQRIETLFPSLGSTVYMNTASFAVGCAPAVDAFRSAVEAWSQGCFDYVEAELAGEDARTIFARLINAPVQNIALIPTVSTVAGLVAAHLALDGRPGNLLVSGSEFTSNLFPWRMLERRGWQVRLVQPVDGQLPPEIFSGAADDETRLIAVSAVQSANGYRVDLDALREIADRSGARLFVDASQMAGVLPLDVVATRIDALAAPSHKFLLGTRGFGYAYFADDLREAMTPVLAGWKAGQEPLASFYGPDMILSDTASRFDLSLAWFNALAERASMRALASLGFENVHRHNRNLARAMRETLLTHGIPFADHGADRGSTIFATAPSSPDAAQRLKDAGIVAAMRSGRIRLSLHVYNTAAQVEHVAALLGR